MNILDIKDLLKRTADHLHFSVKYAQMTGFAALWVPNDTLTLDETFMITIGPVHFSHQAIFKSDEELLNGFLKSSHIVLRGYFIDTPDWPETIQVKNSFYKMSVEELAIQLDLMDV